MFPECSRIFGLSSLTLKPGMGGPDSVDYLVHHPTEEDDVAPLRDHLSGTTMLWVLGFLVQYDKIECDSPSPLLEACSPLESM